MKTSRSERRRPPSAQRPAPEIATARTAGEWREPFARARRALIEWASHLLVVAGLLLGFHGVEWLLRYLGEADRLLFGKLPLTYLFDAGDAALVVGFLGYGVYSVLTAYRS
jgi:hypothetical protein